VEARRGRYEARLHSLAMQGGGVVIIVAWLIVVVIAGAYLKLREGWILAPLAIVVVLAILASAGVVA
jgi:hypothetical protein